MLFDRIKFLADRRKVSLKTVALDLGFSENLIYTWKRTNPRAIDLEKLADYFRVSVDYILERNNDYDAPKLDLTQVADSGNWDEWLTAGGRPLTFRDRDVLKALFGSK